MNACLGLLCTSTSHRALELVADVADCLSVVRRKTCSLLLYSSQVRNFSCSAWNKRTTSPWETHGTEIQAVREDFLLSKESRQVRTTLPGVHLCTKYRITWFHINAAAFKSLDATWKKKWVERSLLRCHSLLSGPPLCGRWTSWTGWSSSLCCSSQSSPAGGGRHPSCCSLRSFYRSMRTWFRLLCLCKNILCP